MASKNETPILSFLRTASLVTYPFAFALSIAHTATTPDSLFPVISLVPQSASTIFSATILYFEKRRKAHQAIALEDTNENEKRKIRNASIFVGDLAFAATLLTCMVFSWIHLQGGGWCYSYYRCYNDPSETVLGVYATVPFMINMTIHFFFVFRAIYLSLPKAFIDAFRTAPAMCPHCHHTLGSAEGTNPVWLPAAKSGVRYSMLNPEENDSLYRDIERQTGRVMLEDDAERGEGPRKGSEETAREISADEVVSIGDA